MNLENWPNVAGRYYVGNKNSSVAVCTLSSIDLLENFNKPEYLQKISIVGKDVTENVGIEKIVLNIISNPKIRFLIMCGKESEGHFVGQGINSLIDNGIDEKGKVVGALGPIPFVKNLTKDQIETFRKQVKTVDMIGCEDIPTILEKAEELDRLNSGEFSSNIEVKDAKTIVADYDPSKEWSADGKPDEGWFTVNIDREKKMIVVEYYVGYGVNAKLNCKIIGKTAEQILGTVVKNNLVKTLYHAGYLGKELMKAQIALEKDIPYEQDGKL